MTAFERIKSVRFPKIWRGTILYSFIFIIYFHHEGQSQSTNRADDAAPALIPPLQFTSGESDLVFAPVDLFARIPQDTSKGMKALNKLSSFMEWYMIYFPMPFGSYSEETNWLFGLTKYNAFLLPNRDKNDTITQSSTISALAYYTLNTQYKASVESNIMFNKNKAVWKTNLAYVYYPLYYYGIGNETSLENQRILNTRNFGFATYYLFNVWKKLYVGPSYDYYNYYDVEFLEAQPYRSEDTTQFNQNIGRQSGLGVKVSLEARDNRLNARRGTYLDAGLMFYNQALGSKFNFTYFNFDLRHYITPWKNLTIAAQVRTESKAGDVPVQSLVMMGGDYFMRGHYTGRYRDHVLVDSQIEMRFPIVWLIGGTVFGGLGQVAPTYDNLRFDSFHHAYGFGFRLKVDRAHNINLRLDIGFSKDQNIIIMNFAEAF